MTILKYYDETDAAWKPFVNNANDAVTLSGDQTIAGEKTFTEDVNVAGDIYSNGNKTITDSPNSVKESNIDFSTFTNTAFPVVAVATSNTNVNSAAWYDQYTWTTPVTGIYLLTFWQRMNNGTSNNDFQVGLAVNGANVISASSGGSTWVNYITAYALIPTRLVAGDVVECRSRGGGPGSYTTGGGRFSAVRIA